MKTRYAILSALVAAMMIACGGGADPKSSSPKPAVYVETTGATTVASLTGITLSALTPGTSTVVAGPFTLTYSATTGKFSGIFNVASGTYDFQVDAVVTGVTPNPSQKVTNVVVSPTKVTALTINLSNLVEGAPQAGFVFAATAGSPLLIPNDGTSTAAFSVTVAPAAVVPTFAWTAKTTAASATTDPNCASVLTNTGASATLTAGTTAEICYVTVKATAPSNTKYTVTKQWQIGVGVDLSVTGQFVPPPTIVTVGLMELNGGFDGTWKAAPDAHGVNAYSLGRTVVGGCNLNTTGGNTTGSIDTCPGPYKIMTGLDPVWAADSQAAANAVDDITGLPVYATLAAVQAAFPIPALGQTEWRVGVTYDMGGVYDAAKPPTAYSVTSCPSSTGMVDEFTSAHQVLGSGPGAPCTATACLGSTFVQVFAPTATAATGDLCTVTIRVTNQGAFDEFPLKVFVVP